MRAFTFALLVCAVAPAQTPYPIRFGHVLSEDGTSFRDDVVLYVLGRTITDIRPAADVEPSALEGQLSFPDAWVIPGLIDLHTHLLLRPYDEAPWEDQVLRESNELRTIRAVKAAEATLRAGFVAVRDLGTEGAGYADVALRDAIAAGVTRGPMVFASTRALVATGCYGPNLAVGPVPKGAQVVDGPTEVRRAVREQIAGGANWIKLYADYRRAPGQAATPTFSPEELAAACDEAASAGIPVAAHAATDEGIARAIRAGVRTIEHGSSASDATLALMVERGVVLCPCLAANEAIARYAGHRGPIVERLNMARVTFKRALAAGVAIACGSDAGVFRHGDNARELELMVEYGMSPTQALAAATSVAATVLGQSNLGTIRAKAWPGLVLLRGDPLRDIRNLRDVIAVFTDDADVARFR